MNERPRTWREVYRRHPEVWIALGVFVAAILLIASWGIYWLWFAPIGSKPGNVIGGVITGAILAWVLSAMFRRRK